MPEIKADLFERLKRKKAFVRQAGTAQPVFFKLSSDENGVWVEPVSSRGKPAEISYEYYSGPVRDLLKSLDTVRSRNHFRIDWEMPSDRIYLAENEYLIWQLQRCDNVVDENLRPIRFTEDPARITVTIEEKKGTPESRVALSARGAEMRNFVFLNEGHVLAGGTVWPVKPLGENFRELPLFETRLLPAQLEQYLSLLFSCFRNLSVRYGEYKLTYGTPKPTQPTLIFERIDPDNALYLRIATAMPGFDADFFESYDISRIAVLNELEKKIVVRDVLYGEITSCFADVTRLLRKHKRALKNTDFFVDDNLFIIRESLAREFIHRELPHLITRYAILGAEKLKSYKIRAVTPRLDLRLSHGIDFLEGDANLEIEGQFISLFDALGQYRKNAYIALSDGTHAIVNKSYMDRLSRIFKKRKEKVSVSFFDLPIVEEMIDRQLAEASFKKSREIFLGFNTIKDADTRLPELNATLRGYQVQGYKWLSYLRKHGLGGCLADDMGLGKTLQAIALLADAYPGEPKPSLIVMPKSLLFNWENEIARFRPELSCHIYHGLNRNLDEARTKQLILTTYAMVRNDIEKLTETEFYYVILDESQNIKNIQSQTSRAAMLLKSDHRLALSGTPIENNLGELYALFRFLNPAMFGSSDEFNRYYATPIQKEDDKDALRELKKKIYPFILRRLKTDVLKDLPDKIEQTLYVEMSGEQKRVYEQRRQFYYDSVRSQIAQNGIRKSQFFILQALSELRQLASVPESKTGNRIVSPKREVLLEHITDLIAGNHKVLIFANYLNALGCAAEDLDAAGIDYLIMTGATRNRKSLVERFQSDETYRVFLMTLKTGGIGLNLTAADYIFIYDPWWNRAAENQAIDRTHRIGQKKTVFSYKLITRGTIEEKILELQNVKSQLLTA
ncbi:helicase SNF [Desulfonema ishimotonii]|uniref:Helicase SNF n=1 Tax=Desulfonema ishimotonii TaxID=45657 RepID=A0A401FVX4_9BACT|nr:DEAD/DEAH box helicase [Desulfonema ishimotonii]GBC61127.1 helicase SNF [Desulfonema ishimotonii]